ncbi:MAG: hypothetical protein U9N73_02840 [Candidatus Auribacterota bacterium]|nr:hypothetical protein [Candidatus Auribacterota bacterium]
MNRIKQFNCPIRYHTTGPGSHFFGFHDLCPWDSADENLVILRTADELWRVPRAGDMARVCIWSPGGDAVRVIGETAAWNWQQGARQQWLPGDRARIIYNARKDNNFVSIIYDLESGKEEFLPYSIYSLSEDGRSAISPNFARLSRYYQSYGYAGGDHPGLSRPIPSDDGIYFLDLSAGSVKLILSLAEIAAYKPTVMDDSIPHFVTHPTINPSGTRFCFMHRYKLPGSGLYSRFMAADMDGSNLKILAEEKVGHFDWYDDDTILVWTRYLPAAARAARRNSIFSPSIKKTILKWLRRLHPAIKQKLYGESLYLVNADEPDDKRQVAAGILEQDGHPMFSHDRRWIITDTYPDKKRRQRLILYNLEDDIRYNIGNYISPEVFGDGGFRCDLHPRWNRGNNLICFDSAHTGKRQVYLVDVSSLIFSAKK